MILGKVLKFPSNLDEKLQKQVMDCSDGLLTAVGDTMCAHDFYEGMSRVWTKQLGYERYLQTPLSLWRENFKITFKENVKVRGKQMKKEIQ